MAKKQAKPKKNATKKATRKPARKPAKTPKKEAKNKPKKKVNPLVGKVGWCSGETLGLKQGHYVFIRRVYGDKCSVNTFTSIENNKGKLKFYKVQEIANGRLYPVPQKDVTLPRFSGVHKNVITNVPVKEIEVLKDQQLKRRHHHYIQKYMNK